MKTRVVLFSGLVVGLALLIVLQSGNRKSDPNKMPPKSRAAPIAKSEPATSWPTSPSTGNVAIPAQALTPAPNTSQATSWDAPIEEKQFATFSEWVKRYQQAGSPEARAALVSEGVALAQARLTAMADLIQSNPQRALELTVP